MNDHRHRFDRWIRALHRFMVYRKGGVQARDLDKRRAGAGERVSPMWPGLEPQRPCALEQAPQERILPVPPCPENSTLFTPAYPFLNCLGKFSRGKVWFIICFCTAAPALRLSKLLDTGKALVFL